MATQVGRKCPFHLFCFWFAFFTTNKTLFLFFFSTSLDLTKYTHWGPDRKTNFDHAGHFFLSLSWLTWKWNAGNLETTSWSFQWANFGRPAWFSWGSRSCSNSCNCCCSSCCTTAGSCFGTRKSQIQHEPGLDFWKVSFDLDWAILWFWMFLTPEREREFNPLTLSSRLGQLQPLWQLEAPTPT